MVTGEVNRVIGTMRSLGWDIGCLYNQETGETPQLYFSHDFKTGDPYALAREVRAGLNPHEQPVGAPTPTERLAPSAAVPSPVREDGPARLRGPGCG